MAIARLCWIVSLTHTGRSSYGMEQCRSSTFRENKPTGGWHAAIRSVIPLKCLPWNWFQQGTNAAHLRKYIDGLLCHAPFSETTSLKALPSICALTLKRVSKLSVHISLIYRFLTLHVSGRRQVLLNVQMLCMRVFCRFLFFDACTLQSVKFIFLPFGISTLWRAMLR